MANVELRPGDTLNIVWKSVQDTPLGQREIESNFEFSYDELVSRLKGKSSAGKSRKSGTEGARFSRIVALSTNALKKENGQLVRELIGTRCSNAFTASLNLYHPKNTKT